MPRLLCSSSTALPTNYGELWFDKASMIWCKELTQDHVTIWSFWRSYLHFLCSWNHGLNDVAVQSWCEAIHGTNFKLRGVTFVHVSIAKRSDMSDWRRSMNAALLCVSGVETRRVICPAESQSAPIESQLIGGGIASGVRSSLGQYRLLGSKWLVQQRTRSMTHHNAHNLCCG